MMTDTERLLVSEVCDRLDASAAQVQQAQDLFELSREGAVLTTLANMVRAEESDASALRKMLADDLEEAEAEAAAVAQAIADAEAKAAPKPRRAKR